jgi:pilin isopeptide linkage protein
MEGNTETRHRKGHVSIGKSRCPALQRGLALVLVIMTLLSSLGMQVRSVSDIALVEENVEWETAASEQDAALEQSEPTQTESETPEAEIYDAGAEPAETEVEAVEQPELDETENVEDIAEPAETDGPSVDVIVAQPDTDEVEPLKADTMEKIYFAEQTEAAAVETPALPVLDGEGDDGFDITPYLIQEDPENSKLKSDIKVTAVDGKTYTLSQLNDKELKVSQGAEVSITFMFAGIPVPKNTVLYYEIPEGIFEQILGRSGALSDEVSYTLSREGRLELIIDESFFTDPANVQPDGHAYLDFKITITGNLSSEHGETPGADDGLIRLKGDADSDPDDRVEFVIPYEYPNYYGGVTVDKTADYDRAQRLIHYTITVEAPESNTLTSKDVYVEDTIDSVSKLYLEKQTDAQDSSKAYYYRNVVAPSGTSLDKTTGVWTVGNMEPGTTVTLTYDVKVSDSYVNAQGVDINNMATVHYNKTGTGVADANVRSDDVLNLTKSNSGGTLHTDDDGNTYLEYTLTVTAPTTNAGTMENISVTDTFGSDATAIAGIRNITASQQGVGGVQVDGATITWDVGSLAKGQTATLTYQAVIDPQFWLSQGENTAFSSTVTNTATVTAGDTPYDRAEVSTTLQKTWITKTGTNVTSGEHAGQVKFVIQANSDENGAPLFTVQSLVDDLNGTYEYVGDLELTRYDSVTKTTKVDGATILIPMDKIVNEAGTQWTLNLSDQEQIEALTDGKYSDLGGDYFYEIVYYVKSSDGTDSPYQNSAGIGYYYDGTYWYRGTGWTSSGYTVSAWKKWQNTGMAVGNPGWKTYITSNIRAGLVYTDTVYEAHQWFTPDNLANLTVTHGSQVLTRDEDYSITATWETYTDSAGVQQTRTRSFNLTFLKAISNVSGSSNVTISYCTTVDTSVVQMDKVEGYYTLRNYGKLTYNGLTLSSFNDWGRYYTRLPFKKIAGAFNAAEGTITWKLQVNRSSTLSGDATVEDILPDGLTYVEGSAYIESTSQNKAPAGTAIGTITETAVLDDDGNSTGRTKLTIPITGLVRDEKGPRGNSYSSYGFSSDGMVTIVIKTRVDDAILQSLTSGRTRSFTNEATLKADGLEYTDKASKTISGNVLSKAYEYTQGSDVKFTLTVNPDGTDLVQQTDDDTITIVDAMSASMALDTSLENYFQVLDEDGVALTEVEDDTQVDETHYALVDSTQLNGSHAFLVTVPDDRPLTIVYYVVVNGVDGDVISISNTAHIVTADYEGSNATNGSSVNTTINLNIEGDISVRPYFYVFKQDQWGNPVEGATFTLYKVLLTEDDADGTVASYDENGLPALQYVAEGATGADGRVAFSGSKMDRSALYCVIETSAPDGYVYDSTERLYVEFSHHTVAENQISSSNYYTISSGRWLPVTNSFYGASWTVPVSKTINGTALASKMSFTFCLVPADGKISWTDQACTKELPAEGMTVTIVGSGTTAFDTLYFNQAGTYTYTLTEQALSDEAADAGYGKDDTQYLITIEVVKNGDNTLTVDSAAFAVVGQSDSSQSLSQAVPTFDNIYATDATTSVTFAAAKVLEGSRAKKIEEGEFTFIVTESGTERASGQTLAGGVIEVADTISDQTDTGQADSDAEQADVQVVDDTTDRADIEFTEITYGQADIGRHRYTIREVEGTDESIDYTENAVVVVVDVFDNGDGTLGSEVTYQLEDESDTPEFINGYQASAVLTLAGTKTVTERLESVKADEFTFTITETDGTLNATVGTMAGGEFQFPDIKFDQMDIGSTHTYVISENQGSDPYITYTDETITVVVAVSDSENSDGSLSLDVKYYNSDGKQIDKIAFVNGGTYIPPTTDIRLGTEPYILMTAFGAGGAVLMIVSKRKRKRK